MTGKNIKYVLFDAANTLIHKPDLWSRILGVLSRHEHAVSPDKLQLHHKLLSEYMEFPDRTSKEFYLDFNTELLLSLGIIPSDGLSAEIFDACTYLEWAKFDDTTHLNDLQVPIGVLSNFNNSLPGLLKKLFGPVFSHIMVSEALNARKPNADFYRLACDQVGLPAENILYIGDSLKLDILPARNQGFSTLLIDRPGIFIRSNLSIPSLSAISDHL